MAVKMLRDLDPVGIRRLLPCCSNDGGTGLILPGQSAQITARPQRHFQATHLLVSRSIAHMFMVDDIKVGMNAQFAQSGSVPADLFATDPAHLEGELDEKGFKTWRLRKSAEEHLPVPLDMPECQVGQAIILTVTNSNPNPDADPIPFLAAWHGHTRGY